MLEGVEVEWVGDWEESFMYENGIQYFLACFTLFEFGCV
jgi:hypothetical protein